MPLGLSPQRCPRRYSVPPTQKANLQIELLLNLLHEDTLFCSRRFLDHVLETGHRSLAYAPEPVGRHQPTAARAYFAYTPNV